MASFLSPLKKNVLWLILSSCIIAIYVFASSLFQIWVLGPSTRMTRTVFLLIFNLHFFYPDIYSSPRNQSGLFTIKTRCYYRYLNDFKPLVVIQTKVPPPHYGLKILSELQNPPPTIASKRADLQPLPLNTCPCADLNVCCSRRPSALRQPSGSYSPSHPQAMTYAF